ncbi:hypothetical protein M422DRAFT_782581 [Sphaerobolus stellatus SS14]|uniref:Uncharacterized protein n=1 Tax=Sphaerobolus stellatus (strain SS14) TaxID=990650 RepID=A0A0C9V107_SPHS4|nr:hypothetical protein M422DRAFT_782581 [Sphaerobolus stellatus SS14]
MLDSSPIRAPSRKTLKRTASLASLPSPPPTVQQPKKRRRSSNAESLSDDDDDDGDAEEEFNKGGTIVGRKLLFPAAPAGPSRGTLTTDDAENPFVDNKAFDVVEQLAEDASTSPLKKRRVLASPPPSKGKPSTSKPVAKSPRTPSPLGKRSVLCIANELPILGDEEDNPFLDDKKTKSKTSRTHRSRSPHNLEERPTMTYVFKGMKADVPNPYYNLPDSAFENSRLPVAHPDYSPPPIVRPKRLFPEAYKGKEPDVAAEDDDDDDRDSSTPEPHTPDNKPRMSTLFVDMHGNALPDSGPQGIRGKIVDASEIGRMAVGPLRGRR